MVNEEEVVLAEIRERPIGFRHLGTSPFCEGDQNSFKRLCLLYKQPYSVYLLYKQVLSRTGLAPASFPCPLPWVKEIINY
jgi:hypothetical protein